MNAREIITEHATPKDAIGILAVTAAVLGIAHAEREKRLIRSHLLPFDLNEADLHFTHYPSEEVDGAGQIYRIHVDTH